MRDESQPVLLDEFAVSHANQQARCAGAQGGHRDRREDEGDGHGASSSQGNDACLRFAQDRQVREQAFDGLVEAIGEHARCDQDNDAFIHDEFPVMLV